MAGSSCQLAIAVPTALFQAVVTAEDIRGCHAQVLGRWALAVASLYLILFHV